MVPCWFGPSKAIDSLISLSERLTNRWCLNRLSSISVSVYPNPSNGSFQVAMGYFEGEKTQVNVFDVEGRVVLQRTFENTPHDFQFSGLPQGYYLLRIDDGKRAESLPVCVLNH